MISGGSLIPGPVPARHTGLMTQQYPGGPSLSERTESWRMNLPRRSRNCLLAGVCGGLAQSWDMSPTLVRLGYLALSLLPGPMWVAYAAAWILMPDADE